MKNLDAEQNLLDIEVDLYRFTGDHPSCLFFPVHIFWEFQSVSVIGVQPLAFQSGNWCIFAELSIGRIQNREALTKPVGFRTVLIPSLKPLTFLAAVLALL